MSVLRPERRHESSKKADDEPREAAQDSRPIKYVQGIITAVDCSMPPAAVLTVVSGNKTWKLKVADTTQITVRGADKFSCAWSKQKAGVNYRESSRGKSDAVWVGLQ